MTNTTIRALVVSGTNLFAGTNGGVFLSTNNGTNWTTVTGVSGSVYAFAVSDTNLFAGSYGGGVLRSTNNGANWTAVNTGLTHPYVFCLAVSGTDLFAGTFGRGAWRRPLSEMITSVKQVSADLPTRFSLGQNYPNPFNPVSTIEFMLPQRSRITFVIYDVLGSEVRRLLDDERNAGVFRATWDGTNASGSHAASGVYYYRMIAIPVDGSESFVQTRRMILLK